MKMKGISRIVIIVKDEHRQKILKTLNKIKADVLSVEDEERDDGKVTVICAIVNERKYWKNRKKFLKFGDVAFLH